MVLGPLTREAREVVEKRAEAVGARLVDRPDPAAYQARGDPRGIAERAGTLAARARLVADSAQALTLARRIANGSTVVVAGSLYLVGEVKALLP